MHKWLIFILLSCATTALAQTVIVAGGEVVAYGVRRGDVVPAMLQEVLRSGGAQQLGETSLLRSRARSRLSRQQNAASIVQTVQPLLGSIRDQSAPYNWLCPKWMYDDGQESEERCLSGCVATCLEQILAYYRYPAMLQDTLFGWTTEHYSIPDMLPGTSFDWDHYLSDYRYGYAEAEGMAIALPTLACGMSVHMRYGLESSGANLGNAVEPLRRAFGYGMVRHFDRLLYEPEQWHRLLQYELQAGRPVAYTGHTMSLSGHAFNIDGVDERGFYHVNWGYNGSYDGWYDLDWLNPWEPEVYDADGIVEGFFCNQTMLCMHPSELSSVLEADTVDTTAIGIRLDSVSFCRQPSTRGYVAADFYFHNEGAEEVTYTYEVMTYLPTDTAIFYQADYVGLSRVQLKPGEQLRQRVYLEFVEPGQRLMGISHDDVTIPFEVPVSIEQGRASVLTWGEPSVSINGRIASFTIPVENAATAGHAGDLVTYCLREDNNDEEDARHFEVLSIQPGERQQLEVSFSGLKPSTGYTLLVRCPWAVQAELHFTMPSETGIASPSAPLQPYIYNSVVYDLNGRVASPDTRGIIISNGRKQYNR